MKNNKEVLNAKETADFLGAHVETVRRLARKKELPAYKVGKDWRFRRKALLLWEEQHSLQKESPMVLVVDDDAAIRKMMKRFFKNEPFRICLASGGAKGLEWVNMESISLILLALKMSGMNGPEFIRELRKIDMSVPVIVVTGYPDSNLMVEAMRHGPLTLLSKPVDRKLLLQTVHSVLKG